MFTRVQPNSSFYSTQRLHDLFILLKKREIIPAAMTWNDLINSKISGIVYEETSFEVSITVDLKRYRFSWSL